MHLVVFEVVYSEVVLHRSFFTNDNNNKLAGMAVRAIILFI